MTDTATKEAYATVKTALSALEFYATNVSDPALVTAKSQELAMILRQKSIDSQGVHSKKLLLTMASAFEQL